MSATAAKPRLSQAGLAPTHEVQATDEYGVEHAVQVAGEAPLTIKVDGREVVTLMTLGTRPEALALGYLRNQRLIENIHDIAEVSVNWISKRLTSRPPTQGIVDWEQKLGNAPPSGCGQGTIFSRTVDNIYNTRLPQAEVRQSMVYGLLTNISAHNEIYKQAGAGMDARCATRPASSVLLRTLVAITRRMPSLVKCGWKTWTAPTSGSIQPGD